MLGPSGWIPCTRVMPLIGKRVHAEEYLTALRLAAAITMPSIGVQAVRSRNWRSPGRSSEIISFPGRPLRCQVLFEVARCPCPPRIRPLPRGKRAFDVQLSVQPRNHAQALRSKGTQRKLKQTATR